MGPHRRTRASLQIREDESPSQGAEKLQEENFKVSPLLGRGSGSPGVSRSGQKQVMDPVKNGGLQAEAVTLEQVSWWSSGGRRRDSQETGAADTPEASGQLRA